MGSDNLVIIRGAGDIASGTINRLKKAGFRLLCLETAFPSAIRRTVSYSTAIYNKYFTLEDVTSVRADDLNNVKKIWYRDEVPIIIDENLKILEYIKPFAIVDAIIAKKI